MFKNYICVKQHDSMDCAAACLATITRQYGLKVPIARIREYAGTDRMGTTVLGIIKSAEKLGFVAKAINCRKESIFNKMHLPAIAHVLQDGKYPHFIVIHKITNKKIIVADPAEGIIKYKIDEFFDIWTGVLVLLNPVDNLEKDKEVNLTSRFLTIIFKQKALLLNIFFASILYIILGITGSFYFKLLMDDILPFGLTKTLHIISIGYIFLMVFKIILNTFRSHMIVYLSQKIDLTLMLGYYNHVLKLPINFFDNRKVGEIISRFMDASKIRDTISSAVITLMIDTIMAIVGGIILYIQNAKLFFICMIMLLLYLVEVIAFNKPLKDINRIQMEDNSSLNSYLIESINGIETLKAFNAESEAEFKTETKFVKFLKSIFKGALLNNIRSCISEVTATIGGIVILWVGAYMVIEGQTQIGELLTFNALIVYFLDPVKNLINLQPMMQTAIVAAERLTEVLDLELEKDIEESKKISPIDLRGAISFKKVNFRYGNRKLILKDIDLTIHEGEKIALVGESGSGKTTLAKLLLNFYQCEKGEIVINDYNIKDINIEILREKIAYISQNVFLFSGTIIENLMLGMPDVSYEQIIDACKIAQAHEFINNMELRYNSMLEENGSNLSGGQKQRLAIARAILKQPDILIMDEATSNLDSITEKAIENTVNNFSNKITTIIIAHRLSTIMRCDKIFVMDKGQIVESGTHDQLIESKGYYYSLWEQQVLNKDDF